MIGGLANARSHRLYAPRLSPRVIDVLDPAVLTPGAVGAYAGVKNVLSSTQGTSTKRPTASATSCNGLPGITFDGGDVLPFALGALLASYSGTTISFVFFDSTGSLQWLFATDGAGSTDMIEVITNDSGGAGNFEGLVSGTGWKSTAGALSSPAVISVGYDKTIDRCISYIRINGVSQTLTNRGSAVTPGSTWSFTNWFLGAADSAGSGGTTGTFGTIIPTAGLLAENSDELKQIEHFHAAKYSL